MSCSWNNPWAGSPTVKWALNTPSNPYGGVGVSMPIGPTTWTVPGTYGVYADVTMGDYEVYSNVVTITVS